MAKPSWDLLNAPLGPKQKEKEDMMKKIISFVILGYLLIGCSMVETAVSTPTPTSEPTNTPTPEPTATAVLDQETIDQNLYQAALDDDVEAMAEWLAVGANPNWIEPNSDSPLIILTAARGNVDTTQLLRDAGAELEVENRIGFTALHMAAINGHIEMITYLLDAGINVDTHSENSRFHSTPLMNSIQNGQVESVETLITAGANVDIPDNHGDPAINWATFNSEFEALEMLLEAGADPNYVNDLGQTPLQFAGGPDTDAGQILVAYGASTE